MCEHDYETKWLMEYNVVAIIGRWRCVEEDDGSRVQSITPPPSLLSVSDCGLGDSDLIWLIRVTCLICEGSYV